MLVIIGALSFNCY